MNDPSGDLSGRIADAAIRVHQEVGPGYLEGIRRSDGRRRAAIGLRFQRRIEVPAFYRGHAVGAHRLDPFIEGQVVVELKAVSGFDPMHFATVRSYLKATNCELGLLLNFAASTLQIKRVGREWHSRAD